MVCWHTVWLAAHGLVHRWARDAAVFLSTAAAQAAMAECDLMRQRSSEQSTLPEVHLQGLLVDISPPVCPVHC